jgi:hypothetical protein
MNGFGFADLCRKLGREPVYILGLQRSLDLHVPEKDEGYSDAYAAFMRKVLHLRALHVPLDAVKALWETEKKLLALLHVDGLTDSPTWYLDACGSGDGRLSPDGLLLSGYRLGFPVAAKVVQTSLDFGDRKTELFKGREMGEDVSLVLDRYREQLAVVRERMAGERRIVEDALSWARTILR